VPSLPPYRLEAEVVAWGTSAFQEAQTEQQQSPQSKLLPRIIAYLSGSQWPSRPTAYGSSRPVTNRMLRQYWELVSMLTEGKPEPRIKLYDTRDGYSDLQLLITKLLGPWAENQHYRDALQDVIGYGLCARGIAKIQWNPKLAGGFGDVEFCSIHLDNFHKLGGDGTLATAECVIEEQIVTLAELKRRYGKLADLVTPDVFQGIASLQTMRPSQMTAAEWSRISPNMRRVIGIKKGGTPDQTYPMARLRHYWLWDPATNETGKLVHIGPQYANWGYNVPAGSPLFPRGRLISIASNRVMDDTCNPYFDATPPYVEFTPLRAPWSPDGMSLMGNLISPQDIINRIYAGLLETVKAGLLPTIIAPRGAMSRADMDNLSSTISGGKMEYNPLSPAPPRYREQPQMPQLAMAILQDTKQEMDQNSGSAAIDAAAQKDQIPSHDTMELIQNSRSYLVRTMGRNLEGFINKCGQKVVARMLQFYSVGHRVALLGEAGLSPMDFTPLYGSLMDGSMAPEDFVRKFQFSIRPGSALAFDKETRIQMALLLQQRGVLSMRNFFRVLDENIDVDQNERELIDEAVKRAQVTALGSAAASAGKQMVAQGAPGGAALTPAAAGGR
jgi:hypothetical protein